MSPTFQQLINSASSVLIVSHHHPDADTIGANAALHLFLQQQGKQVDSFCADEVPTRLQFHPITQTFLHDATSLDVKKYDLIIVVDCGSIALTGLNLQPTTDNRQRHPSKFALSHSALHTSHSLSALRSLPTILNLDHHQDNNLYGDVNIVDKEASSTSEIVYGLIKDAGNVTKDITECLLMGVMYDTTFLSNGATTAKAIQAVSEFLSAGASMKKAVHYLWRNKNLAQLHLWGRAFSRVQLHPELGVAWTVLTQQDLRDVNVDSFNHADLSNYLTSLQDANILLVLIEQEDGTFRGSLRTTRDHIDVAAIAHKFGGGGHKKAAGFSWTSDLGEFSVEKLLRVVSSDSTQP